MSTIVSIDTPQRTSLQQQLSDLRQSLKEYERTFAAENNGHKPGKEEIRANKDVALKYSQYHKIHDILKGKLPPSALAIDKSPTKTTKSRSQEHTSPRAYRSITSATPRRHKGSRDTIVDQQESSSPGLPFLNEIGPTPHRDGRILGLFDGMTDSPVSNANVTTPRSLKRKIGDVYIDFPIKQTPSKACRLSSQGNKLTEGTVGELIQHTETEELRSFQVKQSRTPQSAAKMFALSQFFESPGTSRYLFSPNSDKRPKQTPLLDAVLGRTPQKSTNSTGQDVTPPYLKRSTSFKERLLSATSDHGSMSRPSTRAGPARLQHFRSVATHVRRPEPNIASVELYDEEYEDDLEAMREMGFDNTSVLVEKSQSANTSSAHPGAESMRRYKKKGQKRTTRKSNIRPTAARKWTEPNFVAADSDGDDGGHNQVNEGSDTEPHQQGYADENDLGSHAEKPRSCDLVKPLRPSNLPGTGKAKNPDMPMKQVIGQGKGAKINPNAVSHMNFRTLKIKNKNSKGKGKGQGRFGRGRR